MCGDRLDREVLTVALAVAADKRYEDVRDDEEYCEGDEGGNEEGLGGLELVSGEYHRIYEIRLTFSAPKGDPIVAISLRAQSPEERFLNSYSMDVRPPKSAVSASGLSRRGLVPAKIILSDNAVNPHFHNHNI